MTSRAGYAKAEDDEAIEIDKAGEAKTHLGPTAADQALEALQPAIAFVGRNRGLSLGLALLALFVLWTMMLAGSRQPRPVGLRSGATTYAIDETVELAYLCDGFEYPEGKDWQNIKKGEARKDVEAGFQGIYDGKQWDGGAGRGSGAGSELANTVVTRLHIEAFVYKHQIRRFLDAPCGSSNWWPPLLEKIRANIPCFQYHGMDVVPTVVSNNSYRYRDDPLTTFSAGDVSLEPLPRDYDVILSRDAMQHLSIDLIIDCLENYARANSKYFIIGSYLTAPKNENGVPGAVNLWSFGVNMLLPPFNLTEPIEILDENFGGKSLLVYTGRYLRSLDFDKMRAVWKEMKHRR